MKKFLKENYYLVLLLVVCVIALCFFLGHFNNIMLDFGREIYYPQRILEGKVLYKDLFAIYGPFAYLFNAFLYKVFGIKLSTLYFAGCCSSLILVSGVYFIARKFLSDFLSFSIGILTIAAGVSTGVLFNFSFPYSWAMLYGTIAFLYSLLFLIKYKQDDKSAFLYISSLFAGICISSKYEFAVYSLLFAGFLGYETVINHKKGLKAFGAYLAVPIICLCILLLQGLGINDIVKSFNNIKNMSETQTLKYFYQSVGAYFSPKVLPVLITTFIKTLVSVGILYAGVYLKKRNKIASVITYTIGLITSFLFLTDTKILTFAFLPLLLIIYSIFCIKKIKNNFSLFIIILAAISISLKSVWGMIILSYASFYFFVLLIAFFALLFKCIDKKYQYITGIYILMFSLCVVFINIITFVQIQSKIITDKGRFYTYKIFAESSNKLINYIKNNTKTTDQIVILPEGLTINFLADRKSDDYFNSMLPLYIESFGEENIIKHYKNSKPDYFILTNENMQNYGFKNICNDYAFDLCAFINDNYDNVKTIDYGYRYLIFKRK